jgi:hypothetical protein
MQAYGYGLYAAGNKRTADFYRRKLSQAQFNALEDFKFNGKTALQWYDYYSDIADREGGQANYDRLAVLENFMTSWDDQSTIEDAVEIGYSDEAVQWFKDIFYGKYEHAGHLYEVEVPDDDELLDWDKPLNEQPEKVQAALKTLDEPGLYYPHETQLKKLIEVFFDDDSPAGDFYRWLENEIARNRRQKTAAVPGGPDRKAETAKIPYGGMRADEAASMMLRNAGIKGIRYLDADSRQNGEGTYNYVVFHDDDITITQTLFQTADPDAEPLAYLRGMAEDIPDAADKARVLAELAGLEKLYPPAANKYLAPNGRQSKLNHAQWYAVRPPTFKDYFGDWERLAVKEFLEGRPIADVKAFTLINGKPIDTALDWISKNSIGTVQTRIGDVVVEPDDIHVSMAHTKYPNKVFVLPAVKPCLKKGRILAR